MKFVGKNCELVKKKAETMFGLFLLWWRPPETPYYWVDEKNQDARRRGPVISGHFKLTQTLLSKSL